ncbi:MAG: hydantoinase/oxoprolinase family protein [Alphaproteobacteria bacterium]|nr:hydantoinase/oxoprolinase family protein [Alphaproteobacteria bacterium]
MCLLERANAAIMNACLVDLSAKVVAAFRTALAELVLKVPFFISQNDGTLMSADMVEKYPVHTFASGPTNSMRGAAFLSGVENAIVVDIGGTTTDIGVLKNGFPRESTAQVDIGGVRTNFRMPDLYSIGLGGGTIIDKNNPCQLGPQSVGHKLERDSMVFGGKCLTATDITVAARGIDIGQAENIAGLDKKFVESATTAIHVMIDNAIDRMKTSTEAIPIILVGGGEILVHRSHDLPSASAIMRPKTGAVANAIGAAIAHVGGEIDRVFDFNELGRDKALEIAKSAAIERAIAAGASRDGVRIVEIDEIPLAYLAGSVRVHAKAVGELDLA